MSKKRLALTDPAETAVVDQIQVRLVRPEEEAEWDRQMAENHYLKSAQMVGEQLRYVAEHQGRWLALLGWSAAAYHLKGREGVDWMERQPAARPAASGGQQRPVLSAGRGQSVSQSG